MIIVIIMFISITVVLLVVVVDFCDVRLDLFSLFIFLVQVFNQVGDLGPIDSIKLIYLEARIIVAFETLDQSTHLRAAMISSLTQQNSITTQTSLIFPFNRYLFHELPYVPIQPHHHMHSRFVIQSILTYFTTILKLLPREYQSLMTRGYS